MYDDQNIVFFSIYLAKVFGNNVSFIRLKLHLRQVHHVFTSNRNESPLTSMQLPNNFLDFACLSSGLTLMRQLMVIMIHLTLNSFLPILSHELIIAFIIIVSIYVWLDCYIFLSYIIRS